MLTLRASRQNLMRLPAALSAHSPTLRPKREEQIASIDKRTNWKSERERYEGIALVICCQVKRLELHKRKRKGKKETVKVSFILRVTQCVQTDSRAFSKSS